MGKSRRNRAGPAQRRDPIAKPVKPPSDPELASLREAKILPIVAQLKSSDPNARSSAASAVSLVIQDDRCRKLLLREQVVHTVMTQTLTDSALESRAAGWAILQLLAQREEHDFCVHLFRSDVLTAVEFASRNISDKLTSKEQDFLKSPKAEQTFTLRIVTSLLSLLTNLAEAQDDILEAISSRPAVFQLLNVLILRDDLPVVEGTSSVRGDALACLMVLAEDNATLAKTFLAEDNESVSEKLMQLKDRVDGEGVLACTVLCAVFTTILASKKLSKGVQVDPSVLVPTLTKVIASVSEQSAPDATGWSSPAEYQQLALETLGDIGSLITSAAKSPAVKEESNGVDTKDEDEMQDDEEGVVDPDQEAPQEEEEEEGEGDDEMDEDEMEADMEMVTGNGDDEGGIDDLPILKTLLQKTLSELIRIANLSPDNEQLMRFQEKALTALNNISWAVSLFDLSDDANAPIKSAWAPAAKAIWESVITPILFSDTADLALATQVTSLGWAVARALRYQTPLKDGEHRRFMTLYHATTRGIGAEHQQPAEVDEEDPFRSLGVRCVGLLGQLAGDPAPLDLNREVGTFLVTAVSSLPETPLAVAVEALNNLFDIYGDETKPCDGVFWKDGFWKHLDEAQPKLKAAAKAVDRKTQPELRLRADEAAMNLNRFLAYKKKHQPGA